MLIQKNSDLWRKVVIKNLCHKNKYLITLIFEESQVWPYLQQKNETYFSCWNQHIYNRYRIVISEQGVDELFDHSLYRDHCLLSPYGPLAFF